jgi:FlaA1/EpsC-like NDP-sugar epimerase
VNAKQPVRWSELKPLAAVLRFVVLVLFSALAGALSLAIVGWSGHPVPLTLLVFTSSFALGYAVFAPAFGPVRRSLNPELRDFEPVIVAPGVGAIVALVIHFLAPQIGGLDLNTILLATSFAVFFGMLIRIGESVFSMMVRGGRPNAQRTIVVGSGDAAASFIRLARENENFRYDVVGCVDDEVLSQRVGGRQVLGGVDDLPSLIERHKIDCVIIAIPSASPTLIKRVTNNCARKGHADGRSPAVRILPGLLELLNDGIVGRIRPVQPEDLLPRDPVHVDLTEIAPHLANRVVLVTGAGGSIGSELCRQIAGLRPSLLLLLGHGENSLFAIDEELRLRLGFQDTRIILGDVADASRIRSVFSRYRPHVVFHAAAHKHVPIVEANICEAVRNNVLGTHVVALAAAAAGVAKFVFLSTDKAVNPTSIMGATKRLSEVISQSFFHQTGTEFVTVRFGNVLESRGSVIPTFKRQIENGGPVTITHRGMQRYFMTIPEAVSLVLQAMAIGRDGQVLVLDMGKPVNILTLAETLITLSGLSPYRDIDIVETGIRPGEKLFEEILTNVEGMSKTSHSRVFIAQQERVPYETLALGLRALESASRAGDQDAIVEILQNFVPSYQPGPHLLSRTATGREAVPRESIGKLNGHAEGIETVLEPSPSSAEKAVRL